MSGLAYDRSVKRATIFGGIWFAIWAIVAVGMFLSEGASDFDEMGDSLGLCLLFVGIGLVLPIFLRFFVWLASLNQGLCILSMILTSMFGMLICIWILYPMLMEYYNKFTGTTKEERAVFTQKVRAYLKAWGRQNFLYKTVLPIFQASLLIIGFNLLLENIDSPVVKYGALGILAAIALFLFYKMGAVVYYDSTKTTYQVEIGQTIFDYGDVITTEVDRKTTQKSELNWVSLILAIVLSPLLVLLAILLVLFYVAANLVMMFLPMSTHRMFIPDSKVRVGEEYVPFSGTFLETPMMFINSVTASLFRFQFVNRDFWDTETGFDYIEGNLSARNKKYLDRRLQKIKKKYGEYYY